ncbi:cytochrome b N-terminal domain-containing protein [Pedobacter sp. SD-b]|uniref:Cytochrome b N-terminal domain-containing protein n=1 Tax=Pedobacter segetis TaxID=2793069 RepID=A0ABS1BFA8_9SPHI|nr:cytochrome b N-terminal domain-containing protein [Pedobacter segetis]MBK0381537.1 cytochrome b N-terminal domain-containing protein [Pedobacter segetis]
MGFFKKIWNWIDDRSGISETIMPLAKHLVPPASKWSYVFGSATLFCFILQVATGIGLSLLYQPSSQNAYHSLEYITNQAFLGNVLRGIHYFGASGMILFVGIHMIRVYITASYKFPREMNWISGVILLFLTIAMGFTGQLLRWDANGVWSSVVAAEQLSRVPIIGTYIADVLLGGQAIGEHTLNRFFSYHVFIIPAMMFILVGFHLFLVFRNGISEPPKPGRLVDPKTYRKWYQHLLAKKGVPFWPNAAWRDALFGAVVVICIVGLAIFFGAPKLTQPPDPSIITTTPSPDWYMIPIFALFALMPPKIESYIIVIGPLVTIFALLALPFLSNSGERSPLRRPWAVFGTFLVLIFVFSLLYIGLKAPWSPKFDTKPIYKQIKTNNPDMEKGMVLFYKKGCQYCHQIKGHGGMKGPDLTLIGRTWDKNQLKVQIINGNKNMPAYGSILTKDELNQLVNYLAALR